MPYINTNELYVDVYDFAGRPSLSTFALEQTPLYFVPNYSIVQLLSSTTLITPLTSYTNTFYIPDTNDYSDTKIRWDFGDGTYQISPTGVHSYKWPGQYSVKLYLINQDGESFLNSFVANVNVKNYIEDKWEFGPEPHFIIDIPAGRLSDKLTINRTNSWQNYNMLSATGYTFQLFSSGSGTYYYDVDNYYKDKWAHLKKFFKFIQKQNVNGQLQNVIVDKIITDNTEIYAKINGNVVQLCNKTDSNAFFVGTSGTAEFFYTDDSNKNNTSKADPIFLFANLDTSKFYDFTSLTENTYSHLEPLQLSYLNTKPICLPIIKTRFNPAAIATITTNGLDGEGSEIIDVFDIPKTSFSSTKIPFVLKLKDQYNFTTKSYPYLSSTNTFPATSYYFKIILVDQNNNQVPCNFYKTNFEQEISDSGGFYRGYFETSTSLLSARLSAIVFLNDTPNFEQDTAFILYSQPYSEYIARYFTTSYLSENFGNTTINNYNFVNTVGNRSIFTISQITSSNNSLKDYSFWAGDCDNDTLLKYDYRGINLETIKLSSATLFDNTTANFLNIDGSAAPSCIAIDSNNNAFVTLFDSGSVIKIDNNTNKITSFKGLGTNLYLTSSDYTAFKGYVGENVILPSYVDIDKNNYVYVVLSHPLCSRIIKLDNDLNILNNFSQNNYYFQKIIIDRNNKIWATSYSSTANTSAANLIDRNDRIFLLDTNFNVLTTFDNFYLPGDVTVDGSQNCWVQHGTNLVSKLNSLDYSVATYNIDETFSNITSYIQSVEGMSCNSNNQILIINNFDSKIYFVPANITYQFSTSSLEYINLKSAPNNFATYPFSAYYDSKYQADGDFIGFKWINKFYSNASNLKLLSCVTPYFNLYAPSGNNIMLKINENFDGENMYQSFALSETLQDKNVFFNDFLGTIVGDSKSNYNTALLKKMYEKISNFSDNIADVDVCNIESLISKCEMFGVIYENYQYPYPPSLRRVMDLASIKRNKLFGNKNSVSYSFNNLENLGTIINVATDTFSATEILVAKEKFSNIYKPVNTTLINGYSSHEIIPFSMFNYYWGWGLVCPASISGNDISAYYDFYRLKLTDQKIYNNILDFDNNNTNLSFNLSNSKLFYGDDGIIDQNIAYTLVNGLNLFSSATNVFYN